MKTEAIFMDMTVITSVGIWIVIFAVLILVISLIISKTKPKSIYGVTNNYIGKMSDSNSIIIKEVIPHLELTNSFMQK